MKFLSDRKRIAAILAVFLCLGICLIAGLGCADGLGIYDNTLRLHILANSDTEEDQSLKLRVRDAVLLYLSEELNECETKAEAEALITQKRDGITETAQKIVNESGHSYKVTTTLTEEYYPERTYGELTLPAGRYTSVRILLGEASGHNWWCVLFPQVCTDMATPANEKLASAGFTANQIRLLTGEEEPEYKLKFKILEILSSFR